MRIVGLVYRVVEEILCVEVVVPLLPEVVFREEVVELTEVLEVPVIRLVDSLDWWVVYLLTEELFS